MYELRTPKGKIIQLKEGLLRVGKAPDNDLIIRDPLLSDYHLNIFLRDGNVIVQQSDPNSFFKINKKDAGKYSVLELGDELSFGSAKFFLALHGAEIPQKKKTLSKGSKSFNKQSRGASLQLNPVRVLLIGIITLGGYFAIQEEENEPSKRAPASLESDENLLDALPDESYQKAPRIIKSSQEISAEDAYRQGLRAFSNKNYVQAISRFNQALSEDPSHPHARKLFEDSKLALENEIKTLLRDSRRAFKFGHFQRAKSQGVKLLTILSDQVPGFLFKLNKKQNQNRNLARSMSQEELALQVPCEQTEYSKECEKISEIIRRSRRELGEDEVLQ